MNNKIISLALFEEVAERIRNRIFSQELMPGDRIDEQLLTREFGISRTPLREALTRAAARRLVEIGARQQDYAPMGRVVDEKSVVNGIVGLLATGGSTNHTLHLVAMAKAAGISITWDDFGELAAVTPLIAQDCRTNTASNQPQRRFRPVTVPNSCPRSPRRWPTASSSSVGNGPLPTRVV